MCQVMEHCRFMWQPKPTQLTEICSERHEGSDDEPPPPPPPRQLPDRSLGTALRAVRCDFKGGRAPDGAGQSGGLRAGESRADLTD